MEPVSRNSLVCEYCGEVIEDNDDIVGQLQAYSSIWPPQLYMLMLGNSKLALCVSRVASVARLAEHCTQPSCVLRVYRVNGEICPSPTLTETTFFLSSSE